MIKKKSNLDKIKFCTVSNKKKNKNDVTYGRDVSRDEIYTSQTASLLKINFFIIHDHFC